MQTQAAVIAVAAALVLLWYLLEWCAARERGTLLPLDRHPGGVLLRAGARLYRQRTFLLVLAAVWIAGTLFTQFVTRPLLWEPTLKRLGVQTPTPRPVPEGLRASTALLASQMYWDRALAGAVPELNALQPISHQDPLLQLAVLLGLIAVYLGVWRRQPSWLDQRQRRLLPWLIPVPAAAILVSVAGFIWQERLMDPQLPRTYLVALSFCQGGVGVLASVPAAALLWHLMLQIIRTGRCSFTFAVRTSIITFPAMAAFVFLSEALLLIGLIVLPLVPSFAGVLSYNRYLGIVLLFVPLLILHLRLGVRTAISRHFDVIGDRAVEVAVFGARGMALLLPLHLLIVWLRYPQPPDWFTAVTDLAGQVAGLLATALVIGWFMALRGRHPAAGDETDSAVTLADREAV